MQKRLKTERFLLFLILASFSSSSSLFAQTPSPAPPPATLQPPSLCATFAKQIYDDVKNYSNGIKDRALPWKNPEGLQSIIGKGQINISEKKTLQWYDSYIVQIENGRIVTNGGTLSGPLAGKTLPVNPTLDQIIQNLGQPTKITIHQEKQYNWKCADNNSAITMLTDERGQLLQVEVTNCPMPQAVPNPNEILGGCSSAGAVLSGVVTDIPLAP